MGYSYITTSDNGVRNEESSSFIHRLEGGSLGWACWLGGGVDGHTGKAISIHHCLFLSDSKRAVTDEGDTIWGETAKHGRRKRPGREEEEPGPLKQMTKLWHQLLEVKKTFVKMTEIWVPIVFIWEDPLVEPVTSTLQVEC